MIKIVWKYVKGYKKNTIVCIMGIAFSVMLIFSLVGISNRIKETYWNMMSKNSTIYDVKINDIDNDTMDKIYHDILSSDCEKLKNKRFGTIYTDNELINIDVMAVEGAWQTFYNTRMLEGREPEKSYEICIEEKYSIENKINIADELQVEIYDDEGNVLNVIFNVVGIIENIKSSTSTNYIFTTYQTAVSANDNTGFAAGNQNTVLVRYDPNSFDTEKIGNLYYKFIQEFGMKFPAEHAQENEEKAALFEEKGVYDSLSNSFYGICIIVFICMTIFIYNTISISMTEKIRQYGMLRCVGMDNRGLLGIMLLEEFLYSVGGLILGIIGGKILNSVIADNVIKCFIDLEGVSGQESIFVYIITVGVTFVSVIMATISMLMKLSKKSPLQMLKYEESNKNIKVKAKYKNILLEMAHRNVRRTRSKSRILMSTIFIATLLIIILGNVISSIDFNINKQPGGFAQIEIYSSFSSETAPYITSEKLDICKNESKIKEVYWQRVEYGYDILVNGEIRQDISGVLVYSDNLMGKFIEFNNLSDLESNDDIAVIVGEDSHKAIESVQLLALDIIYGCPNAKKDFNVTINEAVEISERALMGQNMSNDPCIVINETLARKIFGDIEDYSNIYLEISNLFDIEDVKKVINEDSFAYIDLNDSTSDAQN